MYSYKDSDGYRYRIPEKMVRATIEGSFDTNHKKFTKFEIDEMILELKENGKLEYEIDGTKYTITKVQ